MNQSNKRYDVVISLVGIILGLLTLFVWIPKDIDTGVLDIWRRSVRIGDAMLPTFAAVMIFGSSIVIGLRALLGHASVGARAMSLEFMAMVLAVFVVSIAVMWGAGPALVSIWFSGEMPYRSLIDTAPWKYTGFALGGALMIFGFISIARHRVEWRNLGIALVAAVLIALLYDVPFDNLYLPPNGDF